MEASPLHARGTGAAGPPRETEDGRGGIAVQNTEPVGSAARPRSSAVATFGLPALGTLTIVAAWWASTIVFEIRPFLLPAPPQVLDSFNRLRPYLLEHASVTLIETVAGFGLAVVAGLVIGTLIASSSVLERMFYPGLVALNAVPKIAVAPLLVVWTGFGMMPKVLMVVLLCFFPIAISTAAGLMSMPRELGELARSLDASWLQTFMKIRFPNALPQIFVGLKVAIPLAFVGAIIGEFSASDSGLGFVIMQAGGVADTAQAFAAIALLVLMSILVFYALVGLERLLLPWIKETTSGR